jgi:hypothetical protein
VNAALASSLGLGNFMPVGDAIGLSGGS